MKIFSIIYKIFHTKFSLLKRLQLWLDHSHCPSDSLSIVPHTDISYMFQVEWRPLYGDFSSWPRNPSMSPSQRNKMWAYLAKIKFRDFEIVLECLIKCKIHWYVLTRERPKKTSQDKRKNTELTSLTLKEHIHQQKTTAITMSQ